MKYQPVYLDEVTGMAGFGPEGFQMIVDGYKCAKCWEEFTVYTAACPVCGTVRDLARDIEETPRHWLPSPPEEDVRPSSAWDERKQWLAKRAR